MPRKQKSCAIITAAPGVNSFYFLLKLTTALNKMIETASLVIPSPKTSEKSLGCSVELIKETAAITSDEQSREHIDMISRVERLSCNSSPVLPSVILRVPPEI